MLRLLFKFFSSLKLTVFLLGFSAILIFVGTLDQVHLGTHAAQKKYFESFFVFKTFGNGFKIPILPGGFLLCGFLLVNLLGAHLTRFKVTWNKSGIFLVHAGIFLMLAGMVLTSTLSVESQMAIDEGGSRNFSEDIDEVELAIIDPSNPDYDEVISIPQKMLLQNQTIQHPKLPFLVKVKSCFPNSTLSMKKPEDKDLPSLADQGMGSQLKVQPLPLTGKPNEQNILSAAVEFVTPNGSLGTWLLSKALGRAQKMNLDGKVYELEIRPKRYYKSYSLTLKDFKHDLYPGTNIPKNFSSEIQLKNPSRHEDREVLIYMNNPLRYEGETYYQASFANNDTTSILQVVRNPSWLTPYISCAMITAGLIVQFVMHLWGFLKREGAAAS